MGITGLLQSLRPITKPIHVSDLAGLTVGVDGYVWLHRGTYACAKDLCEGKPTRAYLNYAIKQLNLLLEAGVKVTIVLDGAPLPAKRGTEHERRARREESRRKALLCLAEGKTAEAFTHFSKAVDVTPAMAAEWIRTVQGVPNVTYVVAPYEADAQLAFLCKAGLVDGVVTEDSDLLCFGCPRLILKLDQDGSAQQILHEDLFKAPIEGLGDLRGWDEENFLRMCILSGCDYLPSVPGMGLRSAYRLLARHRTPDRALRALRLQQFGKGKTGAQVPQNYETEFHKAFLVFRHQRAFDPRTREMTHVHPLPTELAALPPADLDYLGPPLEAAVAAGIADGLLDPMTLQPFPPPSAADAAAPAPKITPVTAAQPRISAYLKRLPARPPAPTPAAPPAEEQEEYEEEAAASSGSARPVPVYQPGLRKGGMPVVQGRSKKGVGGYLRRTAAALAGATVTATVGLLPRKRPAPTATATAAAEAEEEEQPPSTTGCLPLPQVSSWFNSSSTSTGNSRSGGGGGEEKDNKENVPAKASAATSVVPVRRAAYALPSKRPRMLGASARLPASASALGSFRFRGLGGRGGCGAAQEEEEEHEDEEEGAVPGSTSAASSGDEGGGYDDSLQPPTPGTPFVAAQPAAVVLPPEQDEEEQQEEGGGVKVTTTTTTTTVAYSSMFQEFSFSSSEAAAGAGSARKRQEQQGQQGAGKGTPLAVLSPNAMTPSMRPPQQRPRRGSVDDRAKEQEGREGGSHRTPSTASVAVASFSFESFQFNASDAAALLSSSSSALR